MPAWGASERLAALVGRGRAINMLVTGRTMAAIEALELGLVEEVFPSEAFDDRLGLLTQSIAAAPAAALAGIKASVNAVRPHRNPELAAGTVEAFARTWADPAHWRRCERWRGRDRRTLEKAPASPADAVPAARRAPDRDDLVRHHRVHGHRAVELPR